MLLLLDQGEKSPFSKNLIRYAEWINDKSKGQAKTTLRAVFQAAPDRPQRPAKP